MRALLSLSVLLALAAGVSGCGSPCQDLANRICSCQPAGATRDSCTASVGNQIGGGGQSPGAADQKRCEQLLGTCPDPASHPDQCNAIQTAAGKIACGLAYPTDSGS